MIGRFKDYIAKNQLVGSSSPPVLAAISGGIDSVVMLHLFVEAGFRPGIVHCNYGLRGGESDGDEAFVRELAEGYRLAFYVKRFDTEGYARDNKLSVQMAARRLRYQWFEAVRRDHGYGSVAIGHNKDDTVETFLINLARGTGLKGLTGMKPKAGHVIRPLLFATRQEIATYCHQQGITYREDSTNQTIKYSRNKIRHHIIPAFEQLNPGFLETMAGNMERLQAAYALYNSQAQAHLQGLVRRQGSDLWIDKRIGALKGDEALLYELLKGYGFTGERIREVAAGIQGPPGKQYWSDTHRLIRDRRWLILTPRRPYSPLRYYIESADEDLHDPIHLSFRLVEDVGHYKMPLSREVACVDYDKLHFPLILRKWQQGDYFQPLGMKGLKKISDLFVDRKYSILDKERSWLLTQGEQIIWVVGERLDERFKVEAHTRRILEITCHSGTSTGFTD